MASLTPELGTRRGAAQEAAKAKRAGPGLWRRYRRNKTAMLGLVLVLMVGLAALLAPLLTTADPLALSGNRLQPPFDGSFLGTDEFGRDMWSRLLYGARTSIIVGLLAALVSVVVGVLIGAIAGYFGGVVDTLLMRLTEGFQIIPVFFLAILIVAMFGAGVDKVILVLGLLAWPPTARTTRALYLSLREVEFVEASKALGFRTFHVMFREMLPNALAPIIVLMSLGVAQAVVLEASLGFVGLSDPSIISWGKMLSSAQQYLAQAWWVSVVPGAGIFMLVMGVNLVGDGLNDALGAQSRK